MLIEFSLVKPHHMKDSCFMFQPIHLEVEGKKRKERETKNPTPTILEPALLTHSLEQENGSWVGGGKENLFFFSSVGK